MATTFRLPLAVVPGGGFMAIEQGSDLEVAQSVGLLLATTPGERRTVPDYGLPNPIGSGVDVETLVDVASDWEDRADPTYVEDLAAAGTVQRPEVYPRIETVPVRVDPQNPLTNGLRYSPGLGIDETGRFYFDPATDTRDAVLKLVAGQPVADTTTEPSALTVGINGDGDVYYEEP